jgi:hypothetical protein
MLKARFKKLSFINHHKKPREHPAVGDYKMGSRHFQCVENGQILAG